MISVRVFAGDGISESFGTLSSVNFVVEIFERLFGIFGKFWLREFIRPVLEDGLPELYDVR